MLDYALCEYIKAFCLVYLSKAAFFLFVAGYVAVEDGGRGDGFVGHGEVTVTVISSS